MLGIGFIIAHFIAMQKPQQRKYHSSCNRSVHRGTAHGKQRVKVCKRKTPHLFLMRSFLPPYGDGTHYCTLTLYKAEFSSPCGDKLQRLRGKSPREGQAFAPLTGIVPRATQLRKRSRRYRPLTGMVLKSARSFLKQSSFRSLTGIVQTKGENVMKCTCFRPLAGIVP